ncbi:sigma-54-dependent transcriptional regulator [Sphingomonas sp. LHG3443-2]|uniref:sigma-54-dependent transcriptional regulator n=1 Tax=Sphingomonas sp. LHG3443-2 TaxID=2804639 RepID=UPI003CF5C640
MSQLRLILLGGERQEIRLAARLAAESGAQVRLADSSAEALLFARTHGADLLMAELSSDVPALIAALRNERIAVPVLACGVDAPATRAVAAVRAGAIDYLPLPPSRELIAAALLAIGHRPTRLVGAHPAWCEVVSRGERLARSRMPLLIVGAPGTGKQALARHLHNVSGLTGPIVLFDAAEHAVTAEQLHSELFGHCAGAFDGAVADRPGKLGEAAGGTLLVRHVDRLAADLQDQLAATLPAAGARLVATASSTAALTPLLAERIGVATLTLPSLARRGTDLLLLARRFADRAAAEEQRPAPRFTAEALAALQAQDWAGNVAELEQVLHRALLLAPGGVIDAAEILPEAAPSPPPDDLSVTPLVGRSLEQVERALILGTLSRCGGNRTSASAILGISVRTMRNKLREMRADGLAVAPAA